MKRTIILLACALGIFTANAQSVVESTKFTDNWSVGVNAGVTSPLTHSAFFRNMRATWGIGLGKQVTPVFGLGIEAMTSINTTASKTAFDNTNLSLLTTVNLNNLFGGYNGIPRSFEIEAVAGIGWMPLMGGKRRSERMCIRNHGQDLMQTMRTAPGNGCAMIPVGKW